MLADCRLSCVSNGQDSRTCDELSSVTGGDESSGEIMLFGVRVRVDPMRKSVSLNNLFQYEHLNAAATDNESMKVVADDGYASADDAVPHRSTAARERKRGQIDPCLSPSSSSSSLIFIYYLCSCIFI